MNPLRASLMVACLKLANVLLALACRLALDSQDTKGSQFALAASGLGSNAAPSKLHAGNAA